MSISKEITILVDKVKAFDSPFDVDLLQTIQKILGSTPSIATIEELLSGYKDKRESIVNDLLPTSLHANGLESATMSDGTNVSIKEYYSCKQVDKTELAQWLEEKNYGGIVKDSLAFGKGELSDDVINFLQKGGYSYSRESTIHPQSLNKAIREINEQTAELPPASAATVSIFEKADIKTATN